MFILRFVLVSLIGFLFLKPLVRINKQDSIKPKLVLAFDKSESMFNNVLYQDSTKLSDFVRKIQNGLAENYEIKTLVFDDETSEEISFDNKGDFTDLTQLEDVVSQKWGGENVGALILVTDGIINKGKAIEYTFDKKYPVYTVGVGDTNIYPDIAISEVYYNRLAYLKNEYPIELNIQSKSFQGNRFQLKIFKNDTLKMDSTISVTQSSELVKVKRFFKANTKGIEELRFELIAEGVSEKNVQNNHRNILIEIIDKRQKLLFVSERSHPDEAFFLEAVKDNFNYEVKDVDYKEATDLVAFNNVIILSGIPKEINRYKGLFDKCIELQKNVMLLPGNSDQLFRLKELGIGFTFQNLRSATNEVSGVFNKDFDYFEMNPSFSKSSEQVVPVVAPFGSYQFQNGQSMYYQKIGDISTKLPLVHVAEKNQSKIGVFLGEGYWRWRVKSHIDQQNHENWKEFVQKVFRLLSVKEDRSQFNVDHKLVFSENEEVIFKGELYNESFEPVNDPEVKVQLRKEGKVYENIFSKTDKAYYLNWGSLKPGNYDYEATTQFNDKELSVSGRFSVNPLKLEQVSLVANFDGLKRLSEQTNGLFFMENQVDSIFDSIKANDNIKTIMYSHKELNPLINQKWIFFLLMSLISAEWFFRKYLGAY